MTQSADKLAVILSLAADPLTLQPLELVEDDASDPCALRTTDGEYPIVDGIPHLIPRDADITAAVGSEPLRAWRALQTAAEVSYRVREEGHFSVPTYQPAIDYGAELASVSSGTYLDIGCGRLATPAYMVGSPDKSFIGIDPMDLPASRSFPFARALGDFLPFRNEVFDGAMFSSALDHCISPTRALLEAFRVLRPGGLLLVFETLRPDDERFRRWHASALSTPTQYNKHHNWAFTEESLLKAVSLAGFAVDRIVRTSDPSEGVLTARRPHPVRAERPRWRRSRFLKRLL